MPRAVWLLLCGVALAGSGVATARAAAPGQPPAATTGTTATTPPTTTTTTTTATTTVFPTTNATTTSTTPTVTGTTSTSPEPITEPKHSKSRPHSKKHRRRLPTRPPPDYPAAPDPFLPDGSLTPAAQASAVVSFAIQYLGIPYKWGGATPKTGFDCSGLVQYVFAQLGVLLPHYAAAQYHSPDAVWVAPNRLQPGDLVFFIGPDGTRKAPGHVGIYVGDGYLIDAPHTGSVVRADNLNEPWFADNYVGAKRIVDASLDASHPSQTREDTAYFPVAPGRLLQLTGTAVAGSPRLVAAVRTSGRVSATNSFGLWTDAALGAVLLAIAGAVTYGRRRR